MSNKAIKLNPQDGSNVYWDSTSVIHNRERLYDEINKIWSAINTNNANLQANIDYVSYNLLSKIKSTTETQIGEFTIWEGNVEVLNTHTWHWIGEYYAAKTHLLNKFPLRDGYTRSYKIAMEYSDNITTADCPVYLGLTDANTGVRTEYSFDLTWGSTTSGVRRMCIRDFNANTLPGNHWTIHVTTAHAANWNTPLRVYRIYLLVYDILNA